MALRFFNGIQIDVPDGWADLSTVIVAPRREVADGKKPTINLVVKRRPSPAKDTAHSVRDYLTFMRNAFGNLEEVQMKELVVGAVKGQAVRFVAATEGQRFRQVTLLYTSNGEEISATVTQLVEDTTPMAMIESLLASIRPAAGGMHGLR